MNFISNFLSITKCPKDIQAESHLCEHALFVVNHPHRNAWLQTSDSYKQWLLKELKTNCKSNTRFTVDEATNIFANTLGSDYLFTYCENKVDCLKDIIDLLFISGFISDGWNGIGADRVPNNFVILNKKAPHGFSITPKGMEYILEYSYLFRLTNFEKSRIHEYGC